VLRQMSPVRLRLRRGEAAQWLRRPANQCFESSINDCLTGRGPGMRVWYEMVQYISKVQFLLEMQFLYRLQAGFLRYRRPVVGFCHSGRPGTAQHSIPARHGTEHVTASRSTWQMMQRYCAMLLWGASSYIGPEARPRHAEQCPLQ
jgi:hypothetical protein